MKRLAFLLFVPVLASGCAQVFDSNLYSGIDKYQSPSVSTLSSMKPTEVKLLVSQKGAYEDLKANPAKLDAVQNALTTAYTAPAATTAEKIDAATTLVTVITNSTSVAELASTAVNNITTIGDAIKAKDYTKAIKIFLGNKTRAEIVTTLTSLQTMGKALIAMQNATVNPATDTIMSEVFLASAKDDKAGFAQSALMAAIAQAVVTDAGTIDSAATELAKDNPALKDGEDMKAFKFAMDPTPAGTTVTLTNAKSLALPNYSYAYVATVKGSLPFKT